VLDLSSHETPPTVDNGINHIGVPCILAIAVTS